MLSIATTNHRSVWRLETIQGKEVLGRLRVHGKLYTGPSLPAKVCSLALFQSTGAEDLEKEFPIRMFFDSYKRGITADLSRNLFSIITIGSLLTRDQMKSRSKLLTVCGACGKEIIVSRLR